MLKNSAESEPNRPSLIRLEGYCIESDTRYDVFANSAINQPKSAKLDRFDRDSKLTRYSQRGKKPIPRILNLFLPNTTTKKSNLLKIFL